MPIPSMTHKNWTGKDWNESGKNANIPRNNSPRNNKKWTKKRIFLYALGVITIFIIFSLISLFWITRNLPDPNKLMDRQVAQSTKIYDRTGEVLLYEIHGEEKRTLVNMGDIPDYVKQATVLVEDKDYYKHGGFSVWAIFRTVITNVVFGKKAGGSTLTQQFVKNSILTNEKTYTRKLKELILAYRLEKKFSKDEILQMYFNEIPYGSTSYGIEAASQRYFGKSVRDINLPEAAILAALPQAPSRYSPYGTHKDLLIARQQYIIDLMAKHGYISQDEAVVYKEFEVKFKEPKEKMIAPHFIMHIKEQLSDKYGEKTVEQGGLKIYTTLDLYKQKIAEEAVVEQAEKNIKNYKATNAALVSIDPKNGQVLAMVGSRDYFSTEIDGQVNITTSLRQPGSSIKPIVYAAAFLKGFSPNTVVYDVITNFSTDTSKPYEPRNYNGKEYGPMTLRASLAGSLNTPAVKTMYLAGIDNVIKLASALGYSTLKDKDRFGLSLVLGGGEVRMLEHVNAYSAFAREGEIHPISTILKVEDNKGNILEEYKEQKETVLDGNVARMINDILSDNGARAYIFGEKNWLMLGSRPVAAKTGTTNNNRDAWTVGYTPSLVTGVWVGNNDNSQMKAGADGSVVAAPIWNNYMKRVLGDTPVEQFKKPEIKTTNKPMLDGISGEVTVKIDKASGLLATEYTPENYIEEKTFKEIHSILYYINKDNPLGDAPKNPSDDPQFMLWEDRILAWANKNNLSTTTPPTEHDNVHKPENKPTISILSPQNKETITNPNLITSAELSAPRGINRVEYLLDNILIFTNTAYPFNFEKDLSFLKNGYHNLTVRVCDDIDNCSTQNLEFNLLLDSEQKNTDISLIWADPTSLEIATTSFPVVFRLTTTNPDQTAKINLFYSNPDGSDQKLISSVAPITSNPESLTWQSPPVGGNYKLYGEALGWNGQLIKSEEKYITIK